MTKLLMPLSRGPVAAETPRLVCVPYAGGSARAYSAWGPALFGVDVHAVQPPGRERLAAAPLPASVEQLASVLATEVAGLGADRLAVFGHSLGALVGFELVLRLEEAGHRVAHLFASGCPAPGTRRPSRLHELDDAALLDAVREIGATPAAFFDSPELVTMYLPVLRADFRLAETYVPRGGARVSCAVHEMRGAGDEATTGATGWSTATTAGVDVTTFPGGHFFVHEHESAVLAHIAAVLQEAPDGSVVARSGP